MECKFAILGLVHGVIGELIDTLWNVNIHEMCDTDGTSTELIDTLWNVNYVGYSVCRASVKN